MGGGFLKMAVMGVMEKFCPKMGQARKGVGWGGGGGWFGNGGMGNF